MDVSDYIHCILHKGHHSQVHRHLFHMICDGTSVTCVTFWHIAIIHFSYPLVFWLQLSFCTSHSLGTKLLYFAIFCLHVFMILFCAKTKNCRNHTQGSIIVILRIVVEIAIIVSDSCQLRIKNSFS